MPGALERITSGRHTLGRYTPPAAAEIALPAVLCAAFVLQCVARWILHQGPLVGSLALSGAAVSEGRWWTLVSHIFLHGGVIHVFMNATFAAAVTPSVTRALGPGARGVLRFVAFFLVCGMAGGLTFLALNLHADRAVVGASGALCGLFAAAVRGNLGRGQLASPFSREVLRACLPFLLLNVVLMGVLARTGIPIAWEAHLGGFAAGLLLFGLFVPRPPTLTEEPSGPWSST